jgi:hypothetical protein
MKLSQTGAATLDAILANRSMMTGHEPVMVAGGSVWGMPVPGSLCELFGLPAWTTRRTPAQTKVRGQIHPAADAAPSGCGAGDYRRERH